MELMVPLVSEELHAMSLYTSAIVFRDDYLHGDKYCVVKRQFRTRDHFRRAMAPNGAVVSLALSLHSDTVLTRSLPPPNYTSKNR